MEEIFHNIFQETISYEDRHLSPRNLFVIRTIDRSLMIDTSFNRTDDREILLRMLHELEIPCGKLDIFITHNHPDHTGLVPQLAAMGAAVFMNPVEARKETSLRHCYLSDEKTRKESLRIVGVTREETPEVYAAVMSYTDMAYQRSGPPEEFSFTAAGPGDWFEYGEYRFQAVSLKGHTAGQLGLYEKSHGLLFAGDQVMTGIVPIVGSQRKDMGLLSCYLESLGELKHKYKGCLFLPCHYEAFTDIDRVADRIIIGYMDKCQKMKGVLEQSDTPMTTRSVGVQTYGRDPGPPAYHQFFSCTQIWAKTFSCLEYMFQQGLVNREEREGVLYWNTRNSLNGR